MMFERALKRLGPAFLILFGASSCGAGDPAPEDSDFAYMKAHFPGMLDHCARGGSSQKRNDVSYCYEMQEVRQWTGLWRAEFEGSRFCPEQAENCLHDSSGDRIWLSFSDGTQPEVADVRYQDAALYEIEFVGRRTQVKGKHGHLGVYDHELVVDDVLTLRKVEGSELSL